MKIITKVTINNDFIIALSSILSLISVIITIFTSYKILKEKMKELREKIEELEIKELENASKLFQDGYYSHSVLESFKVLETHLYKKLMDKNIRVERNRFYDILNLAMKHKIIDENDFTCD